MTQVQLVCAIMEDWHGLPDGALLSRSRDKRVCRVRKIAFESLERWGMSSDEIARAFGRDAGTIRQVLRGRKRAA